MKNLIPLKLYSLLLLLSFAFTACGDDPASSNEDPPEFPQFENIEPDLSFFENNNPKLVTTNNYYDARSYALALGSVAAFSQIYFGFFASAEQNEANFIDGKWVWEYNYSYGGESVSITLTAEESGQNMIWEMLFSFNDGQGNSFTDYKMIEGVIALDGESGSWTFNSLDPDTNNEEPFLVSTWTKESETNIEIITEFYDEDSASDTYTFDQNGSVFDVTYSGATQEQDIFVHWNTDAQTGYYQVGSDTSTRNCWDGDFQDVSCSSVGY